MKIKYGKNICFQTILTVFLNRKLGVPQNNLINPDRVLSRTEFV